MAFNAGERANRNPEIFDYRAAEEERLREQFASRSQPGFNLAPSFSDAADRALRGRQSDSPKEIQGSGLNYTKGVPNRSAPRFAGENRDAVALLGMEQGQPFFEAANAEKNKVGMRYLRQFAEQAQAATNTGMMVI